jgi:hypothetical protein
MGGLGEADGRAPWYVGFAVHAVRANVCDSSARINPDERNYSGREPVHARERPAQGLEAELEVLSEPLLVSAT